MSDYPIVKVYIVWDIENDCLWRNPKGKWTWRKKNHARSAITLHAGPNYSKWRQLLSTLMEWKEYQKESFENAHKRLKVIECVCTEYKEV